MFFVNFSLDAGIFVVLKTFTVFFEALVLAAGISEALKAISVSS